MNEIAYVYILSSSFQKLYIGVTSEIEIRIAQHKNGSFSEAHTSRYRIDKLVYFERFTTITAAIAREKQLKRWSRIKKNPPHRGSKPHLAGPERRVGQTISSLFREMIVLRRRLFTPPTDKTSSSRPKRSAVERPPH